ESVCARGEPRAKPWRSNCVETKEQLRVELLLGLEPRTSSLPRKCSTTELQQHGPSAASGSGAAFHRELRSTVRSRRARKRLERAMGIEPTCAAWKAAVLPLNYARRAG